jgi:hypothetical protein
MASDDSRDTRPGRTARSGPGGRRILPPAQSPMQRAHQEQSRQEGPGGTRPGHRLVLELVIFEPEPISGLVGPAGAPDGVAFHGWIDLMSAIQTLYADSAQDHPPAPS